MATILVHQIGFPATPALEQSAVMKLRTVLRRERARSRPWSVEVFFRIANRSPEGRAVAYAARITIKIPSRQRRLVASAEAGTARLAFGEALGKIEKRLRRGARMDDSGRRTLGHTRRSARQAKRQPA